MPRAGEISLILFLIAASASCEDRGAVEPPPPLQSSPWILTHELGQERMTTLRAHRVEGGKTEHFLLSTSALAGTTRWSRSGRLLAYQEKAPDGPERIWIRRFDGQRWYEPQPVVMPNNVTGIPSSCTWSPSTEQLLCSQHTDERTISIVVATAKDEGTIPGHVVASGEALGADWVPNGERVLVSRLIANERQFSMVDIPMNPDARPWPEHPVTPPSGMAFDDFTPSTDERGIATGSLSPDGLWIVFVLKEAHRASKSLYAFSTDGNEPPRLLESCPVEDGYPNDRCKPGAWRPEGATLLVDRQRQFEKDSLDAWSPSTGALVSLGDVQSGGWFSPTRMLARADDRNRLSIIELGGPSPVRTSVPTTEMRSFKHATPSPDGRWLVLSHDDGSSGWFVALDLSRAPLEAREIYRDASSVASGGVEWSPGGKFVLVREVTGSQEIVRGRLIDPANGAETRLEIATARRSDKTPFHWDWSERLAPDDQTLAIDRDGSLALWKIGSDTKTAVVIKGIPSNTRVSWPPVRGAR